MFHERVILEQKQSVREISQLTSEAKQKAQAFKH